MPVRYIRSEVRLDAWTAAYLGCVSIADVTVYADPGPVEEASSCPWCGSPCPDPVCTCSLSGPLMAPLYAAERVAGLKPGGEPLPRVRVLTPRSRMGHGIGWTR